MIYHNNNIKKPGKILNYKIYTERIVKQVITLSGEVQVYNLSFKTY